jgi:DNA-binding winged helix-turn-helix (wHTH) protein/Tol biopolymer transport system component
MSAEPSVHQFGPFRLDSAERLLLRDGQPVSLTPKAFDLLVYLVEHAGRLVTKHALVSALWPNTVVEEANLTFTMSALRKALGDGHDGEQFIQTVPTRGYRFVAAVTRDTKVGLGVSVGGAPTVLQGRHPRLRSWASIGGLALLSGAVIGGLVGWILKPLPRSTTQAVPLQVPARLEITLPSHMRLSDQGEISPDGRHIVVVASVRRRWQLVIRDLPSGQVIERDDTERAVSPFWSPDSQSIGFFADRKLKRIALSGGPARELADAKEFSRERGGATWASGVILFPSGDGAILEVPETGGTPTVVATLPWVARKRAFGWPRFLPDGRRFLVTQVGDPALYWASLDTPGIHKLPQDGSRAVYAAGHLLFFRGVGLYARPFDAARIEFTGSEMLLAERAGFLSASDTGTVLYRAESRKTSSLTWFDRRGRQTATVGEAGEYGQVVLAASGKRAAVVRLDTQGAEGDNRDLWQVDLSTGIFSSLTTNPALDSDPSWSPDERHVAFTSSRTGVGAVYVKDIVTGNEDPLVVWKENVFVDQWTPDGKFVIFRNLGRAVWAVGVSGDRTPKMLADTPEYSEDEVHVSPDGRWVAFNAAKLPGRWDVYVAMFPGFTAKRQISGHGGVQPQWSGNGRELFYLDLDGWLMAIPVNAGTGPVVSQESRLFPTRFEPDPHEPKYAVTADGARFLGLAQVADDRSSLTVLLNALPNISGASAR